jgi:DNA primase
MDTKKLHTDFIEKVKEQTDIIDVVLDYTNLSKVGKEYQGLCPFHNERSPSFSVSPTKNLAHCFGCGWGGNAIKFLMELNNVSITEAVLDLARRSNIRVQYDDGSYDDDFPAALPKPERKEQIIEASSQPGYDPTKSEGQVTESIFRLLNYPGDAEKARAWLADRGITPEMIKQYRLGLTKRVVKSDKDNPQSKETYSAIAIHIPVPNTKDKFYVKKRVAPWLVGDERPDYLNNWSQAGVPATIWFTYKGEDAQETFFCEGEWDAIALGELARTRGEKVAVACSTSGCGTVPSQDQLDQLPGKVRIFYDRDEAGVKGSRKLAEALGDRGQVCLVPMPDDCTTKGWDVSNALSNGYQWEDFVKETLTIESKIVQPTEDLSDNDSNFKETVSDNPNNTVTKANRKNNKVITEDEWGLKYGLPELLRKLSKSLKPKKGFEQPSKEIEELRPNKHNWRNAPLVERKDIQDPEIYKNEGSPLLLYRPGDMPYIWQQARFKGYKAVVDTSTTGEGKSHTVGNQNVDSWFPLVENEKGEIVKDNRNKLFYASQSGQNTTASTLENWEPLARRHNGLILRSNKLTGGGNPFIERTKPNETPDIASNCWAANLHNVIQNKNLGLLGGNLNPICEKCPVSKSCKKGVEGIDTFGQRKDAGFRGEMKQSLTHPRIKGTLTGFPQDTEFKIVGFIDEAALTIQATKDIEVKHKDAERTFFNIFNVNKDLYKSVEFIYGVLTTRLAENKQPKYGYDFITIKSWFTNRFDNDDFKDVLCEIDKFESQQNTKELDDLGEQLKECTTETLYENLSLSWLSDFCKIMAGLTQGSIRIVNNILTLTVPNSNQIEMIKNWDFRVFLDATGNRNELAKIFGYEPHEILWVQQAPNAKVYDNVKVIQVKGLGKLGKQRRSSVLERLKQLETALGDWASGKEEVPILDELVGKPDEIFKDKFNLDRVACIRHLKFKEEKDLYYFGGANGQRGSNAAEKCQMLVLEGLAMENLGAALANYHTIHDPNSTFENADFKNWYTQKITDEAFQGVGRSRYTRRPDEIIPTFIISDADISALEHQYGFKIHQVDASDITIEAGNKRQQKLFTIVLAAKRLEEQGQKLTQSALAQVAKVTQGCVSKLLKDLGGWQQFKKLFQMLYIDPYSKWNNSETLTETEEYVTGYTVPVLDACLEYIDTECDKTDSQIDVDKTERVIVDVARAIKGTVEAVGEKGLEVAIENLPLKGQVRLLSLFYMAAPAGEREQLQDRVKRIGEASAEALEAVLSDQTKQPEPTYSTLQVGNLNLVTEAIDSTWDGQYLYEALKNSSRQESFESIWADLSEQDRNQIEQFLAKADEHKDFRYEDDLNENEPEEEQPISIPKLGSRIEYYIEGQTFYGELVASAPNDIWYILWDKISASYKRMKEIIGESIPELPPTLKGNQLNLLRFDSEL